jgi:hypothetical protein
MVPNGRTEPGQHMGAQERRCWLQLPYDVPAQVDADDQCCEKAKMPSVPVQAA